MTTLGSGRRRVTGRTLTVISVSAHLATLTLVLMVQTEWSRRRGRDCRL